MKKYVSTILILFYVFASVGFGSIHYYCNMSLDVPNNMVLPECACSTSGMDHVTETNACCSTDDTEQPQHDHSSQSNQSQYAMDCCTVEINYYQADDVVLKMNDFQKFIHTVSFANIISSEQIDNTNFFDKNLPKETPLHRNLPLLI